MIYDGMTPYLFCFSAEGRRHKWVRFYRVDMYAALDDCKAAARREYPLAHGFIIYSDQGDEEIRKSWGLPE